MSSFIFPGALPRPVRPSTEADIITGRVASRARWERRRFWLRLRRSLLSGPGTACRSVWSLILNQLKTRQDHMT
ncbi:hypothetical protein ACOI1H_07350 [Loktanella sp. DJP18]|uniref:hypothetical protein n=1 Tax=Loktanella sp. DJP18 TaxID=3409788 RepID=UPI003BB7CDBE